MKTIIIIYFIGFFICFICAYYNEYKRACKHNRKVKNPYMQRQINVVKIIIKSLPYPVVILLAIIETMADINLKKDK